MLNILPRRQRLPLFVMDKEIYRVKTAGGKVLFRTLDFRRANFFCQEYKNRKTITLWRNNTIIRYIYPD